jgi:hypothetical protein
VKQKEAIKNKKLGTEINGKFIYVSSADDSKKNHFRAFF